MRKPPRSKWAQEQRHYKQMPSGQALGEHPFASTAQYDEEGNMIPRYLHVGGGVSKRAKITFSADPDFNKFEDRLKSIDAVLIWIAINTPARLTVRQYLSFMMIAIADLSGKPHTLTTLKEAGVNDKNGFPIFSSTLNRSYQVFMSPDEVDDTEALGWIVTEQDAVDKRLKYLRLTTLGREKAKELLETM